MNVTKEWLSSVSTPAGGYTRKQLALLGVPWPPPSGWKRKIVGTLIDAAIAEQVAQIARDQKRRGVE